MSERSQLVSVVLPCLNEQGSVGNCVARAREAFDRAGLDCEVVVCDNGSTDASADEAEAAGARLVAESRRGYGFAVTKAVEAARGDVLLIADADGTYPMEDGPAFAGVARGTRAVILGSRFAGKILPGSMPVLHRLIGSPATRLLLRVLFGIRCSDPHSGMRAMQRSVFEVVRPSTGGWQFTVEMLVNASRRSVPVQEIPIAYHERVGTSKLRALPEGWGFFRFLILHSPTYLFAVPGGVGMALGVGLLAWLAFVDRTVGPINFGVNTLVVGALATIVGYQVVALGASARAYMRGREPRVEGRPSAFQRWFSLERGILVGLVLLAAGLGLVANVGVRWVTGDFGVLPRSDHGLAIVGLTTSVVGMQTIFSSFFLSVISQNVHGPDA